MDPSLSPANQLAVAAPPGPVGRLGRRLVRRAGARTLSLLDQFLPHAGWADRIVFQLRFLRELGRLPRPTTSCAATYNDFLLERMLREDWDPLERVSIDKQHAKLFAAALCPGLMTAETLAVFHLSMAGAAETLAQDLSLRSGRVEVAKPTHGSGSVLFLRRGLDPDQIRVFVAAALRDFHRQSRESQYRGLERKVIIEQDLSAGEVPPADCKFFCSHGEILFCEVVTGRYVDYRRHVVTADFTRSVASGHAAEALADERADLDRMVQVARRLSQPFRFVRVDLYSLDGKVHFGELSFVPHAATGALVSEGFRRWVMARIASGRQAFAREGHPPAP